jgi:hypothetical protein
VVQELETRLEQVEQATQSNSSSALTETLCQVNVQLTAAAANVKLSEQSHNSELIRMQESMNEVGLAISMLSRTNQALGNQ